MVPRGSILLAISPFAALMNGQVSKLNNLVIPVIALVDLNDLDLIQQCILFTRILNVKYWQKYSQLSHFPEYNYMSSNCSSTLYLALVSVLLLFKIQNQ